MSCRPSYPLHIERDIKRYDKALEIRWNNRLNRFELWRRGKTNYAFILRIQNEDGSYRPVDRRLLSFVINNDCWKFKSPREAYNKMLEWDKRDEDYRGARIRNRIEDITREKAHWMNRDFDSGKGDKDRSTELYKQNYDLAFGKKAI